MKILILGGTGMLGHRLWLNLSSVHKTWVTVRGDTSQFPDTPEFTRKYILLSAFIPAYKAGHSGDFSVSGSFWIRRK